MAQIFRAKKSTKPIRHIEVLIDSMDHQGRGVARVAGKVCFVEGALTGEKVKGQVLQDKSKLLEATVVKVLTPSPERVPPFCEYYERCGGCSLQHQQLDAQIETKQQAVTMLFAKFAGIDQLPWQPCIRSEPQHYRRAARIASLHHKQSGHLQLGFREKQAKKIVEVSHCDVLVKPFDTLFDTLRNKLNEMSAFKSVSHIQLCQADNGNFVLLRHTRAISDEQKQKFVDELKEYVVVFDDGETAVSYARTPYYQLANFGLKLSFTLANFIQVNQQVNEKMLQQAVDWLELSGSEKVLDLFCGVGNFSLVLAKQSNKVIGVEGEAQSVAMAKQNAQTNQITNCQFYRFDLTESIASAPWFDPHADILLLDPSRPGALEVLKQLPLTQFKKILYVSCDPVTLARDSKVISQAGFELNKVGLMNMFVHTSHIETMALFLRR
ncbi:23S rRNA (uracil(1939)-C(5))-methyltransferase RlmD [Pseudoalteromonas sp. T1lg65]|uniref:23S rRNA (uracil(1939)-C(5))-methyltransferase RlmD n=1 Tax=Pseudoalteromonas sp. T1lg65 TaxID=2077101 RepID=UPI003F79C64F